MPDPLMALLLGLAVLAGTAVTLWPHHGLWARWQQSRHLNERIRSEDALKHIHKWEMKGRRPTVASIAGAIHARLDEAIALVNNMQQSGLVTISGDEVHLTPTGRETALHIIRAHRLWELYLAEETGFDEREWHSAAEQREHLLTAEQVAQLADQLVYPTHDPHAWI
jgi:DtxR family transcriptional regulator, Mn-dependent transcriptional regulator